MSSAGVQSWTYSAIDNSTINAINIAENCPAANINNAIRQAMSSVMQELVYQGADISASVSMSLAGVDWRSMNVTGSASIIHVGTGRAGLWRVVTWNSPSTLVNSANILLDGQSNIVTATNDVTIFISQGSGAWRGLHFPIAAGTVQTANIADQAVTTAKLADVNVTTGKLADGAVTFAKMQAITDGRLLGASGGTAIEEISLGAGLTMSANVLNTVSTGTVVQVQKATSTANTAGSGTFALGGSALTTSGGDQYLSVAITPTSAAHLLRIDVLFHCGINASGSVPIMGLFQDATANAINSTFGPPLATSSVMGQLIITHWMTAATTSATTFKVRFGASSGTSIMNAAGSGGSYLGGVVTSSITVTEYS